MRPSMTPSTMARSVSSAGACEAGMYGWCVTPEAPGMLVIGGTICPQNGASVQQRYNRAWIGCFSTSNPPSPVGMAPSEASRVLRDVAWALAYAHGQGVIHRDVKPDNILIETGGRVLVADFGIASVVAGAGALSTGEVVGTPEFMSPEQALGEAVDARSDLYSLGIVGYFAFSGTLPFEGEKATEVLAKQVTEPAPPLASVAPGVPRRIAQAIDRCLSKDRDDRPEGTSVLADQLSRALEQRRELPLALRVFV